MIALLQRVTKAGISVDEREIAAIGPGLCVFIAVEKNDGEPQAVRMAGRLMNYRVFPDDRGRMNRSLKETGGELLMVPNFTLDAETKKGTRASFTPAAGPEKAKKLFGLVKDEIDRRYGRVCSGVFGANMQVRLVNDGPVTFRLECRPATVCGASPPIPRST